jgi:hypothetical protein
MATTVEILTQPGPPFRERVTINDLTYTIRFSWNNRANCWSMEFWDAGNSFRVLCGVALVTGADLLEQFAYLPLGAHAILTAMTIGPALSPDTMPNATNLGIDGHLYLTTP